MSSGDNQIEVNDAQLVREAEAALASAPADEFATGEGGAPELLEAAQVVSWGPLVNGFGPMVRLVALPQWNIRDDEGQEFAESLTLVLDMLFPGGLDGKYAPFARLAAASIGIVGTRYIINGGKLPPLGPKRAAVDKEDGTAGAGGAGAGAGESAGQAYREAA